MMVVAEKMSFFSSAVVAAFPDCLKVDL